jgi:hypothetical protein
VDSDQRRSDRIYYRGCADRVADGAGITGKAGPIWLADEKSCLFVEQALFRTFELQGSIANKEGFLLTPNGVRKKVFCFLYGKS